MMSAVDTSPFRSSTAGSKLDSSPKRDRALPVFRRDRTIVITSPTPIPGVGLFSRHHLPHRDDRTPLPVGASGMNGSSAVVTTADQVMDQQTQPLEYPGD